ncbi:MAG TPA: nucleotide pyrophosphohydrolase [Thermoanaerobaculia bacterium]|nr:nucleotide pyrophosphohydrolase [Thermoanaerobaculia bacterium]
MSFAPIQKEVDQWIEEYTPGYFRPLQMIARLTEELGEVSRAVSHRFGEKKPKAGEEHGDIAGEIADLVFVAVCLANSLEIDLDEAFGAMMTKLKQRDGTRWK